MTKPHIVWLRRDLRLADQPAFFAAAQAGPVIPVYVLDDEAAGSHSYGGASRWWLHHSLESLGNTLGRRNARIILRRGDAVEELTKLAEETGAEAIHAIRHYEPWWRKAQGKLSDKLDLQLYDGNYLFPAGHVTTGSGNPYKIYTPFSKAIREQMPPRDELPEPETLSSPGSWPDSDDLADWNLLPTKPDWAGGMRDFWTVGERAAHERLDWWLDHVDDYDDARNLPSKDKTSQMSPHLHFGEISPVQIWHRFKDKRSAGWKTFEKELIWRDYAQNVICQFPAYPKESYRDGYGEGLWRNPNRGHLIQDDLNAWQQGQTGYPIVDAGMRQLWQTGWMHNRVRMICASFLVKHLLIDWTHGEQWFWDTLVDADYGSNGVNWQWVAGTGVDSNMFVRIMAPLSQSEKFDAAAYIREYVPELADLDEPYIHDPEEHGCLPADYPAKIIGHREARERALAAYREMKGD
ncbi:deoxyribodipyrimidine photo-lyase [Pontixanthobacter aestiaquae]|uniref:Deoxyribodipyrimidine photo-lyase n=1 Tax=Pontixanthobacter aestiaquae TaxID=1509367 RepID=A0A844Z7H0_9SPHN|nr:deoxyribodipyrimidine photo-lyase [Pontixanthobacter aestiaquae]MDN3645240.1 deoxyribodipyrimidine photo-lyase [Pontixanthobacter aestiaquae]MXO83758.1 deoxyribodipyrimidine photo-lyase [Pontixanthobacter aestiaquae]